MILAGELVYAIMSSHNIPMKARYTNLSSLCPKLATASAGDQAQSPWGGKRLQRAPQNMQSPSLSMQQNTKEKARVRVSLAVKGLPPDVLLLLHPLCHSPPLPQSPQEIEALRPETGRAGKAELLLAIAAVGIGRKAGGKSASAPVQGQEQGSDKLFKLPRLQKMLRKVF